ncbi:hypothetical protein ACFYXM_16660 [Streptomyces sp. NPDC002476]|uniref:hypothetical protein n=1 Tax=Streptomyces sp. NPDC002476 TaxID=3364648 RepID=UPI003674ABB2
MAGRSQPARPPRTRPRHAYPRPTYARTVRRALRTVPHYRERYAATGALPPLTRAEVDERRHLLMPLGEASPARRDPGLPAAERTAELYEALRLAGHRTRGLDVYEVARSLRDPVRAHGSTWRVLLDATAHTDPYAEPGIRPGALPEGPALVVGDPGTPGGRDLVRVARTSLAEAAGSRPSGGSLWYEPWLGHLGAVPPSCGELHLNTGRVHARLLGDTTVLTLLRRRRPTLVHVCPEAAERFRPERCPVHGTPIVRRTP